MPHSGRRASPRIHVATSRADALAWLASCAPEARFAEAIRAVSVDRAVVGRVV